MEREGIDSWKKVYDYAYMGDVDRLTDVLKHLQTLDNNDTIERQHKITALTELINEL